ncbi:D(4) dopamine receptor [Tamandua tetradactyla]|uniref:D(4) dopamine receptor n=1 Tax=Tamandua tetradactyla TaxID=48850 RepID=UPI0040549C32
MGNRSAADAGEPLAGRGPGAGAVEPSVAALAGGVLLIGAVLAGNSLVCVSVAADPALHTPTNYFLLSLAAADLLLALLVLPLFVYSEVQGGAWRLSLGLCNALLAADVMLCTASIFNLCAISVDRFVAVTVPLRYHGRGRRQLLLISATWLLAAAVAAPVLCGLNDAQGRDPSVCRLEDRDYVVYSSVCSFFLPCLLMLLLYWATFRGLRRRREARRAKLQGHALPATLPPPDASPPPVHRRRRAKIPGREGKAMRALPVVVGTFLLCWTPFFVVHVTRALCPACASPARLVSAVTWLGYANSALNPAVYTIFNARFRARFRRALRPSCCSDPPPSRARAEVAAL